MKSYSDFRYFLVIALISFLTVSVWFRHGYQLGTAEGGLPFNNLQRHAEIFRWAWGDGAMGNSTSFLVASYPTYFFLSEFEKIRVPGFVIEAVVFWFILTSSGIGIFLIGRKIVLISGGFSLFAVFFYWLSPFVLVNVWNRFLYNHIFFLALLPLSFYTYWRGIQQKKYSYLFLTVLITFFYSYALTALALTTLLFAVFGFVSIYWIVITKARHLKFIILYNLLFGLTFGLVHAWWLSQLLFIGSSANFTESVSSFFSTEGNISGLTEISRKLGSFIDLTRYIHFNFFYDHSASWSQALSSPLAFILNSVILLITFIGIVMGRKNRVILFFSLFFVVSFFFSKGNSPPFGELYTYFFVKIPFLQIFRNPVEKIGLISVFCGAFITAFALDSLHQKFIEKYTHKFEGRNYVLVFSLLLIGIFWGWPFFSGTIFSVYKNAAGEVALYQSYVPGYYKEADKVISADDSIARFLALPLMGEGITYLWPIPYSGIDIYSTLFHKQNIALNTTIPFYNQVIYQLVTYQLKSDLVYFLPYLAVDHILLRRDIAYQERSYPDPAYSEQLLKQLENEEFLEKKTDFDKLSLYEVKEPLNWGKFYITNQVVFTNGVDFAKMANGFPQNKRVYVNPLLFKSLPIDPVEIQLFPDKITAYNWLKEYQSYSIEDLYAKLLYVRHSPDDVIYPFVRSKELLNSLLYADYPKWVLFNTNLLGKRAVEICRYDTSLNDPSKEDQLFKNYQQEFNYLKDHIQRISNENRALKSEIFQSVITQALLLDRCQKIKIDFFLDFFADLGIVSPFSRQISYENLTDVSYQVPKTGNYRVKEDSGKNADESTIALTQGLYKRQFLEDEIYTNQIVSELSDFTVDSKWIDYQRIEIDDYSALYSVKVEYEVQSGDHVAIYAKQDNNFTNQPRFIAEMPAQKNHFTGEFSPSLGAKYFQIGITGDKNEYCIDKCLAHHNSLKLYVKKLQIIKKSFQLPYFVLNQNKSVRESPVSWSKKSPVEYEITVSKTDSQPEILVFSELFGQGWEIQGHTFQHILVNGFANGWILDKAGTFKSIVYYLPQRNLDLGYKISFGALFATVCILWGIRKYESDN